MKGVIWGLLLAASFLANQGGVLVPVILVSAGIWLYCIGRDS